jgi:hypothetical protein
VSKKTEEPLGNDLYNQIFFIGWLLQERLMFAIPLPHIFLQPYLGMIKIITGPLNPLPHAGVIFL